MLDALLIALVAGLFVMLITSRRRLRGPIPLMALPRLHDAVRPSAVQLEVPVASRTEPRAAPLRTKLFAQAVANAMRGVAVQRRRAVGLAVVVAASAVVWFVWPTPYRALPLRASGARIGKSFEVVALRQQRITGRVDALVTGGGWVCLSGCN